MKKYILPILILAALSFVSCQQDMLSEESVIKDSTVEMNDFDYWLEANFLKPYNIEFKYRFSMDESDKGFWNVPADIDAAIIYAHLVKYLCIDTYDEIAGIDFTRSYFPKMFFLVGTWEYRNNGSFVLGTAEAGKKIMLSGVNGLPDLFKLLEMGRITEDQLAEELSYYYIKTIHHEFTHILNQTKSYPENFGTITSSTYVGDACFDTDKDWRGRGYITAYSQSEHREDFAELLSEYITHDAAWWDQQLKDAHSETTNVRATSPDAEYGDVYIQSKIDIVRAYMADSWGIDIDELRDILLRRFRDVTAGRVDLNTVEL